MTDAAASKAACRRIVRERCAGLDDAARRAAGRVACARIATLPRFAQSGTVMLYVPIPGELDVTPLAEDLWRRSAVVCVPIANWDERTMMPGRVEGFGDEDLAPGRRGVREPRQRRLIEPAALDLIVVPGVAFDGAGGRLGRGAGFYDRFLAALPVRVWRIGVAFDVQIVDRVPMEEHDARLDVVVSESRVILPPEPSAPP